MPGTRRVTLNTSWYLRSWPSFIERNSHRWVAISTSTTFWAFWVCFTMLLEKHVRVGRSANHGITRDPPWYRIGDGGWGQENASEFQIAFRTIVLNGTPKISRIRRLGKQHGCVTRPNYRSSQQMHTVGWQIWGKARHDWAGETKTVPVASRTLLSLLKSCWQSEVEGRDGGGTESVDSKLLC